MASLVSRLDMMTSSNHICGTMEKDVGRTNGTTNASQNGTVVHQHRRNGAVTPGPVFSRTWISASNQDI